MRGQWNKSVPQVELASALVLGIHEHSSGRNLSATRQHSPKRIEQEQLADSSAAKFRANRKPAKKRRGNIGIPGKFFRHSFGKISQAHNMSGQSVEAGNRFSIRSNHESGRDMLADILAGLPLQISVEFRNSAGKNGTVVFL